MNSAVRQRKNWLYQRRPRCTHVNIRSRTEIAVYRRVRAIKQTFLIAVNLLSVRVFAPSIYLCTSTSLQLQSSMCIAARRGSAEFQARTRIFSGNVSGIFSLSLSLELIAFFLERLRKLQREALEKDVSRGKCFKSLLLIIWCRSIALAFYEMIVFVSRGDKVSTGGSLMHAHVVIRFHYFTRAASLFPPRRINRTRSCRKQKAAIVEQRYIEEESAGHKFPRGGWQTASHRRLLALIFNFFFLSQRRIYTGMYGGCCEALLQSSNFRRNDYSEEKHGS